jgi:hypothetical protein
MKEIIYDRTTRDYALYLDGELVGFAGSYHEGEIKLDQLIYARLAHDEPKAA